MAIHCTVVMSRVKTKRNISAVTTGEDALRRKNMLAEACTKMPKVTRFTTLYATASPNW